jgi:hypothetical protein
MVIPDDWGTTIVPSFSFEPQVLRRNNATATPINENPNPFVLICSAKKAKDTKKRLYQKWL